MVHEGDGIVKQQRIEPLRAVMARRHLAGALIVNPENQFYISGFKALIYSRPILLLITDSRTGLVIPALEEDHATAEAAVDELLVYYEHPEKAALGTSHLVHLERWLAGLPAGASIGVELGAAPAALVDWLREHGCQPVDIGGDIKRLRFIKTPDEIEAIRAAGRLVDLAVSESLAAIRPGATELTVDAAGNAALFAAVAAQHPGATLDLFVMTPSGVERSVMPHVLSNTRALTDGDVLIHSRQVGLSGYRAECERTCFVGRPSDAARRAFDLMVAAQTAAMAAMRPGVPMMAIDAAARQVISAAGLADQAFHRTGHGIGLSSHEEPYLRFDEELPLVAGMAFSIEPGFYVPGLGGFRHSDTVIVTDAGIELLTHLPRDLEHLVF
jgi:Xaa-Pro dipeptidase